MKMSKNSFEFQMIDEQSFTDAVKASVNTALEAYPFSVRFAAEKSALHAIEGMDFSVLWTQWVYPRQGKEIHSHSFQVTMTPVACGAINSVGRRKPFDISVRAWSLDTDRDTVKKKVFSALEDFYQESEILWWKASSTN